MYTHNYTARWKDGFIQPWYTEPQTKTIFPSISHGLSYVLIFALIVLFMIDEMKDGSCMDIY